MRLYVEILDDPKVAKMDPTTFQIFIFLLLLARERDRDGAIDMSPADIAWRIRQPEDQIAEAIENLKALDIISKAPGPLVFLNWSKRQYRSDDVTARVKLHRAKHETLHETLQGAKGETLHETLENRTDQNRSDQKQKKDLMAWSDEARAFIGIQAEDRKLWSEAYQPSIWTRK